MKLELDDMPLGLVRSLGALGIPEADMPETIREVARTTDDPIAAHHECGFMRGILGSTMCRQGHHFVGGEPATDDEIVECWRRVSAQEG